nr:MAG TPA: ATP synthase [Caudoviricetes sp.]
MVVTEEREGLNQLLNTAKHGQGCIMFITV